MMDIRNVMRKRFSRQKSYLIGVGLVVAVVIVTIVTSSMKDPDLNNQTRFISTFQQKDRTWLQPQPQSTDKFPARDDILFQRELDLKRNLRADVHDTVEFVHENNGSENTTFYVYNEVPSDTPIGKVRRLPQCIVFGSPKAGTFTLKTFLGFHPDVVIPAKHEIHFFNQEENYKRGYSWYIRQMSRSLPGQVTLEKTPQYLYSPESPERIYRMNKTIKLMMVVRHPFHRAVSAYVHKADKVVKLGRSIKKFENMMVDKRTGMVNKSHFCLDHSLYGKHLQRWLKKFDLRQIHIIDGDNLVANPAQELKLVEQFLGVKPYFEPSLFHYNENKGFYCLRLKNGGEEFCMPSSKGRPHPEVSKAVRRKLLDYFEPHNQMFYKMVGRDFKWTTDVNLLET